MSLEMTEKQLLATFIMEPSLICKDIDDLFSTGNSKIVYNAIMNLQEKGENIDAVTVAEAIGQQSPIPFTHVGDVLTYLAHTKRKFLSDDIKFCLSRLKKEKARKEILVDVSNPGIDFEDLKLIVNSIDYGAKPTEGITASGGLDALRTELDRSEDEKIYSGFPSIDRVFGGWRKGETAMFMGRTTVGKTWVALSIIREMVLRNHRVSFFSLEGAPARISCRMLQVHFDITQDLVNRYLLENSEDMKSYLSAMSNTSFHHRIVSPQDIAETIDKENPDVVIVDFLGLMRSDIEGSSYERASETVKALKSIAVDKNVFLLYLHQISRQGEDGSVPVRLNHARDSGQIEELTDYIVGMWRPEIHSMDAKKRYGVMMEVLKNKSGDSVTLEASILASGRIVEKEWREGKF